MTDNVTRAREAVIAARREASRLAAELKAAKAGFDATHSGLIRDLAVATGAVDIAEGELKALAVEHFKATGEKQVGPGVSVALVKDYAIDAEEGLKWAKEKGLCLIPESLDMAAIKKQAAITPLPFVTITEVPKARLATDLDAEVAA